MDGWLHALGEAGIGAVQIREKDLEDRALYGLARLARSALPPAVRLLVNGRIDVAVAAGADGVHLPADGVPVAPLRARFGPRMMIGRSTHRLEEVKRARDEGADYVTFGPVYETPGKGAPVGLGELARAAAAGLPVYALGGVTLERFGELAGAGVAGIAAIRLFQTISDLPQVARAAREHFRRT
jgi:thiamine-phosphate pyrophosphorylase